jgi:hypothetical protein
MVLTNFGKISRRLAFPVECQLAKFESFCISHRLSNVGTNPTKFAAEVKVK